jgi:anti-anti-sigma factor
MQFGVDIVRGRDLATLLCRGRLVFDHGAPVLRDAAHRELSRAHVLALDLGSLTQVDANGVGVLAGLCDAAQRMGRGVVLVGTTDRVSRLLHLTRLETLLPTVDLKDCDSVASGFSRKDVAAVECSSAKRILPAEAGSHT